MGAGLLALLSKSPPSKDEGDAEEVEAKDDDSQELGLEDEHLTDAFDAIKSGDKDAFMEAMKSAIGCCMGKE